MVKIEIIAAIFNNFLNNKQIRHCFCKIDIGIDRFTGLLQEIDIRYEFGLKVILKGVGWKKRFLQPFSIELPINK